MKSRAYAENKLNLYKKYIFSIILSALAFAAVGLIQGPADAQEGPPPGPMPVTVSVVQESATQIWTEYSGRLAAVDSVEIRPQVSGTIKDIRFEDGQMVTKGNILLVIDPAPYEARAAQAQAAVATAKSQLDFAQRQLKRAQDLMKTNAISADLLDERRNNASAAKNAVESANASLRQAKIDLDYAYVEAPITGRVGRAEITEGNLVQAGPNAPVLTTIVSNDALYADFDVDEQAYLQHVRGAVHDVEAERAIPVRLTVRGDKDVVYEGTVHSFDNSINTATGTIRARALFKNADGALLPGMYANIQMGSAGQSKAILITERAVGTDQDRKFVYVIGPGNKVVYREVKLGASMDGQRVVLAGLKPGEKIIVEGLMRVRPDMIVAPQPEGQKTAAQKTAAPPAVKE